VLVLVLVLVLVQVLVVVLSVVVMYIFSVGDPTQNLHTENPLHNMDSIHRRLIEFVAVAIV
jgi:hypothetical protein